jgi:hypothetical protein
MAKSCTRRRRSKGGDNAANAKTNNAKTNNAKTNNANANAKAASAANAKEANAVNANSASAANANVANAVNNSASANAKEANSSGGRRKTRKMAKGPSDWNKKVMMVYHELKKKNPATKLGDAMRECSKRKKRGEL